MAFGKRPETDTDEFLQSRLEANIREQCELHGWAAAITIANPVDILILLEELDNDPLNDEIKGNA